MRARRPTWLVVSSSPFGRALVVVGIFFLLFLHAVAYAVAIPHDSWLATVWVVVMTMALLAVELRRKRLTDLFATLGMSGAALWGPALIAVGLLETLFRVALVIAAGF